MNSLIYRKIGKNNQLISLLAIGTTWFGRPWPAENHDYAYPSSLEILHYLDQVFAKIQKKDALLMIDTAAAYGKSEKQLGRYFKRKNNSRTKTLLATKWGEEFDLKKGISTINHSKEQLRLSLKRSLSYLEKIDLLYIHRASNEVLSNPKIINEMTKLKKQHFGNIQYLGASFSDEKSLDNALANNLVEWLDIIQLPACVFLKRPDLMSDIRKNNISIVLNSPIRRGKDLPAKEIYADLLTYKDISAILTGTRHHLKETIGYFLTSK